MFSQRTLLWQTAVYSISTLSGDFYVTQETLYGNIARRHEDETP